ncbi:MAG TPA: phosphopyruvate hydratase [bacterium]|nr:phosphopyruvate hydratase [bacterium]HNS34041.1 phosphopyruvate hydratase [bacterium]HNZ73113.1 phosphopyruvate hydratase [bacterium]HOH67012.1 phosphopyruvate hydratase [bacterium]HQA63679.1 phosphopyruvate hydratase [bacterium]
MSKIKSVKAREILDSRGNPTVETEVVLTSGVKAWAAVPSGASTGSYEALELRDGDKKRYDGNGVLKAVKNVNEKIAPKLKGWAAGQQKEIDKLMLELDGTENKSKLGANAILGVSLAVARAGAIDAQKPLYAYLHKKFWPQKKMSFPVPMMNIMNGGAHAGWSIDIQEFMITPQQKNIKEAVRCGAEIFHALKKILKDRGYQTTVGDEGGYAPKLPGNEQALKVILEAVAAANYRIGKDVKIAIDAASSEFYKDGIYNMVADKKKRSAAEMVAMYSDWLTRYPIESLEDGLAEDDWDGWKTLTNKLGKKIALVGDDLFVTNVKRLQQGIEQGVSNAILIKLNQIGSLTETVEAIKLAQTHSYKIAVSHRSGETVDDFISDLAVACGAEYIKTGSLCRSERVAKYNRLMEIWDEMK